MNQSEKHIKSYLKRISNILVINGGFLDSPGLYTGEMGLAVFFFHYASYTKNEIYSDYGYNLIEKMQNRIHQETSIEYKHGLTGIGSSIEYLVQNGYIEEDTDEILEDFDNRIFSIQISPQLPVEDVMSIRYYTYWIVTNHQTRRK